MRAVVGVIVLAACGGGGGPAPAKPAGPAVAAPETAMPVVPPEPVPEDPRVAVDLKSFDFMWQRVHDTFYDPKFDGVDWAGVRAELRPKMLATKSREEAREVMNQALSRLKVSHFGVIGPLEGAGDSDGDADEAKDREGAKDADIGADVRILEQAAVITRIDAGSPAAKAKLPLGGEIVSIDGVEIAPRLAQVAAQGGPPTLVPLYQARAVSRLIRGPHGSKLRISVRARPGAKVATLELARALAGTASTFGNLGTHRLVYEVRRLEPKVGYLRLSMFLEPPVVMPAFAKDLAGFADTAGVVIDLRGNPGGIGGMAMGMAGHLISDQNKKLGTMRMRQSTLDFVVNPQAQRYSGKIAILIDDLSGSTSEIFAGGLQDLGRARVFGRRSAGAALPSVFEILPNGDRLQYAIADYVSTSGKRLEGNGVTPDVPIALDLPALRAGKDPDLVAATRWIKEKP